MKQSVINKSSVIIIALTAALLASTGCADSSDHDSNGETSKATESQDEQANVRTTGQSEGKVNDVLLSMAAGPGNELTQKYIGPLYADAVPGSKLKLVVTDEATAVTKALTEKGGAGSTDVLMVSAQNAAKLASAGTLDNPPKDQIPNWENIRPAEKSDYCAPQYGSAMGIIYNPKEFADDPPDTLGKFFTPKVMKKVGALANEPDPFYYMASALDADGDPGNNWLSGKDIIAKQMPLIGNHTYTAPDELGQALISGAISATIFTKARQHYFQKQADTNFEFVIPEEGSYYQYWSWCIPANAPHKQEAYALVNAMLDPAVQVQFAKEFGYAPGVSNAELPADLKDAVDISGGAESRMHSVDWDYVGSIQDEMTSLWRKDVLTK